MQEASEDITNADPILEEAPPPAAPLQVYLQMGNEPVPLEDAIEGWNGVEPLQMVFATTAPKESDAEEVSEDETYQVVEEEAPQDDGEKFFGG